jgi:hypothetical protein
LSARSVELKERKGLLVGLLAGFGLLLRPLVLVFWVAESWLGGAYKTLQKVKAIDGEEHQLTLGELKANTVYLCGPTTRVSVDDLLYASKNRHAKVSVHHMITLFELIGGLNKGALKRLGCLHEGFVVLTRPRRGQRLSEQVCGAQHDERGRGEVPPLAQGREAEAQRVRVNLQRLLNQWALTTHRLTRGEQAFKASAVTLVGAGDEGGHPLCSPALHRLKERGEGRGGGARCVKGASKRDEGGEGEVVGRGAQVLRPVLNDREALSEGAQRGLSLSEVLAEGRVDKARALLIKRRPPALTHLLKTLKRPLRLINEHTQGGCPLGRVRLLLKISAQVIE